MDDGGGHAGALLALCSQSTELTAAGVEFVAATQVLSEELGVERIADADRENRLMASKPNRLTAFASSTLAAKAAPRAGTIEPSPTCNFCNTAHAAALCRMASGSDRAAKKRQHGCNPHHRRQGHYDRERLQSEQMPGDAASPTGLQSARSTDITRYLPCAHRPETRAIPQPDEFPRQVEPPRAGRTADSGSARRRVPAALLCPRTASVRP